MGYVTDETLRKVIISYVNNTYEININMRKVYIFHDEWLKTYYIKKYPDYDNEDFYKIPTHIPCIQIDEWKSVLNRRNKIDKIKNKMI